ncbi:MAG: MCE family protein [Actinomycetota bacterium]|nr:MCE family protein [Actinomycetota bacterium]MDA8281149.1 MCE family protein [Actinomycetota bacterium]
MRGVRSLVGVALAGMAALGLAACGSGGAGTIDTSAVFSDVHSLTAGASVQLAEIDVGSVTGIHLHGNRAEVTMAIQRSAHVPANVTAELVQTTILGQYVVSLVPGSGPAGLLRDHQAIGNASVVPGIQQLVQSGAAVFGAVNAAQLSQIIASGARGLGGQGPQLRSLLDDFGAVLSGYATQSRQITSLVDRMASFSGALAPDSSANAQALANLSRTAATLAQQSGQFIGLLHSLDALAVQGRSILDTGLPQLQDQIDSLGAVAAQLQAHQQQLATLLQEVPVANQSLSGASYHHYLQILNNLVVCGVPALGGGSAATSTCNGSGGL